MKQKEVDFLIVGQGIVGTMLAFFLLKKNQRVLVIDKKIPGSASQHSSGIINPITGRRFAKTWQIDTLLPFARETYKELEVLLHNEFVEDIDIIKPITSTKEENDLSIDLGSEEQAPYFPMQEKLFLDKEKFNNPLGAYKIKHALKLNIAHLLNSFKEYLINIDSYQEELFEYEKLDIENSMYNDMHFKKIIFCQGFANIHNPFFNDIDIIPNKGEYLIIQTKEKHQLKETITSNGIISPLSEDTFYIGATYEWVGDDVSITKQGRKHLCNIFENICKMPYEIIKQGVGLRPAIQARRPIIGMHAQYKNIGIMNAMGAKGTSLAPYYASQFSQFLLEGKELDKEVSLKK